MGMPGTYKKKPVKKKKKPAKKGINQMGMKGAYPKKGSTVKKKKKPAKKGKKKSSYGY